MAATLTGAEARRQQLHDVLLSYLQGPHVTLWPGGDGLTAEEVLREYPEAVAAGQVPGREELLQLHPDLADELAAFFAEQG